MIYGSVCSGIEAASAAWHPLGWRPAFFSEIEAFPRAVLQHRFPDVPLHGDFTTIGADQYGPIDLLVGGTPCQSFSIAGLRGGLDDDRGNLALEFLRLADRTRARWVVWENVPGVLSSNGGRDFGSILGGLGELGYGWAYRVLDAQFFGVAQRRRRVFVVGHLGDWRRAAAVLFERHSLSGHPAPRRETGEDAARSLRAQSQSSHREDSDNFVAWGADVIGRTASGRDTFGTLTAKQGEKQWLGNQGGDYVVQQPMAFDWQSGGDNQGLNPKPTAQLQRSQVPAVAFEANMSLQTPSTNGVNPTLTRRTHASVAIKYAVRRLTPRECERLQGFPDDYTAIPYRNKPADQCPDGPRYKALGNSMAVPVMRWIGERIAAVDAITTMERAA